ncbi:hypothetical protein PBOI14_00840 [Pseudomonas sp. Boi14]|nr:hypothetical protein PBOI14_00840 [Pseudomonas sp. Boi14]
MAEVTLKKLVTRLLLVVVAMFVFGFALVPIYDVMCKALGINGKTGGQYADQGQQVDVSRQVRVQFLSTNAIDMVWDFYPKSDDIVVHPGAVNEMIFIARNPSDHPMSAQAIPSISPAARPCISTRPSASALPSRCCSRARRSRCRCVSSLTVTCPRM